MTRHGYSLRYPVHVMLPTVREVVELSVLLPAIALGRTSLDPGLWVYMRVGR